MNEMISTLSTRLGLDPEMVEKGLAALLSGLKGHLPPEVYSALHHAIPDADAIVTKAAATADDSTQHSRGLLASIVNLAGKLFGGETSQALTELSKAGFSAEQIEQFVIHVFNDLETIVPKAILPTFRTSRFEYLVISVPPKVDEYTLLLTLSFINFLNRSKNTD